MKYNLLLLLIAGSSLNAMLLEDGTTEVPPKAGILVLAPLQRSEISQRARMRALGVRETDPAQAAKRVADYLKMQQQDKNLNELNYATQVLMKWFEISEYEALTHLAQAGLFSARATHRIEGAPTERALSAAIPAAAAPAKIPAAVKKDRLTELAELIARSGAGVILTVSRINQLPGDVYRMIFSSIITAKDIRTAAQNIKRFLVVQEIENNPLVVNDVSLTLADKFKVTHDEAVKALAIAGLEPAIRMLNLKAATSGVIRALNRGVYEGMDSTPEFYGDDLLYVLYSEKLMNDLQAGNEKALSYVKKLAEKIARKEDAIVANPWDLQVLLAKGGPLFAKRLFDLGTYFTPYKLLGLYREQREAAESAAATVPAAAAPIAITSAASSPSAASSAQS